MTGIWGSYGLAIRAWCATLLCAMAVGASDSAIQPLTVCEVLKDLPAHDGKVMAVLGRFSFRQTGRWMGEDACVEKPAANAPAVPAILALADDSKSGPKPPQDFEIDGAALVRKLKAIVLHTSLRQFRFGTPDYDRWAIVYGRVEAQKSTASPKPASSGQPPLESAPARLVFRGDGVVYFLADDYLTQ